MSSIEPTNITPQVSSINNTASENSTRNRGRGRGRGRGGRRGGGGRGGSFHDSRSENINTSPQISNTLDIVSPSPSIRNNSAPRRNEGRLPYSQRNSQGSRSRSTDNNISENGIGESRGYNNKNRFQYRKRRNNNENGNNYNQNTQSTSILQNEGRSQENEYHSDGSSSRRRNNKYDRPRTIAVENQFESQDQFNNSDSNQNRITSQSVNSNSNEPRINESDPKGKKPTNTITEASSSLNQRNSRPHTRPIKSPVVNLSPEEIKDVLTSITHGLSTSTYECMICCENIRPSNKTWFCEVCWAVFHLSCTQKWAKKSSGSRNSEIWRCPGCQNNSDVIPEIYKCFCGKVENPPNNRYFTPHSCGNVCGRKRDCIHDCTLLCHPGPCPPCSALAPTQYCYCGRKSFQLRCIDACYGSGKSCGDICGQLLGCGKHYCEKKCHDGECPKCNVLEMQKCYCGQTERETKCGDGTAIHCYEEVNGESNAWTGFFSCKNSCNRLLECGQHSCTKRCHSITGDTEPCPLDPSRVKTCPCGSENVISLLGHERLSCTDEIPLCGNICKKLLPCRHECQEPCHHGNCKPCNIRISVKCRCGSTEYERICSEVAGETGELPICDKVCGGNKNCGKHQCTTKCCPSANKFKPSKKRSTLQDDDDENHRCTLICGKKLQCGRHNCQLLCHRLYCMRCLEASFEELTCHCGRTKLFPPIPCGTKLPPCPYSCTRSRNCDHPAIEHPCHNDEEPCPPCPYLVSKKCICGKSVVKNVPCHKTNVSCGQVCDLPVSCGGHRCKRICHLGDCLANTSNQCAQICGKPREACGHPCTAQCHAPTRCPEDIPCKTKTVINCECGHLSQEVTCDITTENALEMKDRHLKCNDNCARAERNRKLANALEITDRVGDGPFIKAIPEYEDDLFDYFAANKEWAKNIETILGDFILKSEKLTLNLPVMKPPYRKFIHELCVHYHLSSESVDVEPKRSVIVKKKADTIVPSVLLSQAYINYNKSISNNNSTASATSSTPLEQSARKSKQPINAIYLSEIKFGVTVEELHKIIEPLMGKSKFQIKWVIESDAIVLPSVGTINMDELEILLSKLKLLIKDLIVAKGIAGWVEFCWVNSKYEVAWRERGRMLNNPDGSFTNRIFKNDPRVPSFGNNNPFDMLANLSNSTSNGLTWNAGIESGGNNRSQSSSSLSSKDQIIQQKAKEPAAKLIDIVDDWELNCDE